MRHLTILCWTLLLCGLLLICGCQKQEPIRIGFIGGLTGKAADLGVAGRNGVQLAVEQRNAAGGINGRPIELVIRDDEQNPETAKRVLAELLNQNIELIIGPMTSSIAMALLPQINASQSILLSPDVTTTEVAGKDDNFLRVIGTTTDYATKNARLLYQKHGIRTVAIIYDTNNRSYSESWLNDFRKEFLALGGKVLLEKGYHSSKDTVYLPLAKELLSVTADSVVFICNSVDAAQLCQHVRKLAPRQHIAMSEWASTERFMELAGASAEGVVVSHFFNRNDESQRFKDFMATYRARFNQDPGFSGVTGYDAALVAMETLTIRKKGSSLKETIIAKKSFDGLQPPLNIDRFGDSDRRSYVSIIKGNQYIPAE